MTSELIERVARAVCGADGAPIPEIRSWHRRYAQAAIEAVRAEQAAELAKFKALAEMLAGELQQIEVDAMEYYNEWRETGCDQKDAIRFALDVWFG